MLCLTKDAIKEKGSGREGREGSGRERVCLCVWGVLDGNEGERKTKRERKKSNREKVFQKNKEKHAQKAK